MQRVCVHVCVCYWHRHLAPCQSALQINTLISQLFAREHTSGIRKLEPRRAATREEKEHPNGGRIECVFWINGSQAAVLIIGTPSGYRYSKSLICFPVMCNLTVLPESHVAPLACDQYVQHSALILHINQTFMLNTLSLISLDYTAIQWFRGAFRLLCSRRCSHPNCFKYISVWGVVTLRGKGKHFEGISDLFWCFLILDGE